MNHKIKIVFLIVLTIVLTYPIGTHRANAQLGGILGCQNMSMSFGQRVPVQDNSTDAMKNVECTWNGLAWTAAKLILQQLTASVVNWINSGFEGSPSFITDPGSFFADAADQVTGAFIANSGVLSRLCSPFSLDIRLSIALQSSQRKRYTCTLNTVINNVMNSSVRVNGAGGTIKGFMNGDFSQGGWPAYVTMVSEPQNNIYGAYFQAKSDLEQQIANKQNNIRMDLSLGRGFLSYKKCTDVNADQLSSYSSDIDVDALEYSESTTVSGQDYYSGAEYSLTKSIDKNGTVSYKDCRTETPGSVIAGSIDKSLGISQDTLNLADSINEIVGALFSQLISKVLTGGLYSASGKSSGGGVTKSITAQLLAEKELSNVTSDKEELATLANTYQNNANQLVSLRRQAVSALANARALYETALICLQAKNPSVSYVSSGNVDISSGSDDEIIAIGQNSGTTGTGTVSASNIGNSIAIADSSIAVYQTKLNDASRRLAEIQSIVSEINSAQTKTEVSTVSTKLNTLINNSSIAVTTSNITEAQNDLSSAQSLANTYTSEANAYQLSCYTTP